jgi:RNA polymerase sigma factor (sigma-70 family)
MPIPAADRDALLRLADDGCPHDGTPPPRRLTPREREAVVAKWWAYSWELARTFHRKERTGRTVEELHADVLLGFAVALDTFDPSLGYAFSTYATGAARQAVIQGGRLAGKRGFRYAPRGEAVVLASLSAPFGVTGREDETRADAIPQPEPDPAPAFPADFWARVRGLVTAAEFRVLSLHFRSGLTHKAIAARLGCSRANIHATCQRALEKLRRRGAWFADLYEAA